jgi:phosphoribosylformimino-5-aminoimidazole carboxamide ribotide isomerase
MALLLVIPSIDIYDGKIVRVVQGIPELNVSGYGDDPLEMAAIWRTENAKALHIVDHDAFKMHSHKNYEIIKEICDTLIIPIVYSGGIRTVDDAERMFDAGISRIAVSTIPIEDPGTFEKIMEKYGTGKVIANLDIIDNEIVIKGRKVKTGIAPIDLALRLKSMGIARFIVTDVKRNGMVAGPNIALSKSIAEATGCKITHSGGIRNKDELMDLQNCSSAGIDSVIIGRALYENRFPCQKLWRIAESGLFSDESQLKIF